MSFSFFVFFWGQIFLQCNCKKREIIRQSMPLILGKSPTTTCRNKSRMICLTILDHFMWCFFVMTISGTDSSGINWCLLAELTTQSDSLKKLQIYISPTTIMARRAVVNNLCFFLLWNFFFNFSPMCRPFFFEKKKQPIDLKKKHQQFFFYATKPKTGHM